MESNPWTTLSRSLKYDNPWIEVHEHQVLTPAGSPGIYGVIGLKNMAIGVLPLTDDLQTYLVGQWRYPLGQYSWEIPEGGCPLGTDPLETARRELLEETGLQATDWTQILTMHLSNSVSNETGFIYLAQGLTEGIANPEETEVLALRKVKLEEAYRQTQSGEITDAVSILAIQQVWIRVLEGRL